MELARCLAEHLQNVIGSVAEFEVNSIITTECLNLLEIEVCLSKPEQNMSN